MPLFVCDKCKCIENTALGFYWARKYDNWADKSLNGLALCSECAPPKFADGRPSGYGTWHGKFPKEKADRESILTNGISRFVISKSLDEIFDARERTRFLSMEPYVNS